MNIRHAERCAEQEQVRGNHRPDDRELHGRAARHGRQTSTRRAGRQTSRSCRRSCRTSCFRAAGSSGARTCWSFTAWPCERSPASSSWSTTAISISPASTSCWTGAGVPTVTWRTPSCSLAGVKLNEESKLVLAFTEVFTRVVLYPSRGIEAIARMPERAPRCREAARAHQYRRDEAARKRCARKARLSSFSLPGPATGPGTLPRRAASRRSTRT